MLTRIGFAWGLVLLLLADGAHGMAAVANGKPIVEAVLASLCDAPVDDAQDPCEPVTDKADIGRGQGRPHGYVGLANPAAGRTLVAEGDDPLAIFSRRPLDDYILLEGGLFLDPGRETPHYGVDYAAPVDYLEGQFTYVHPISPGFVTARASCWMCFVDGDAQGRVGWKLPRYNFGWGGFVLVEVPYSVDVSIYVMYAHLERDFTALGDYVTPEDVIGVVGTTGYSQQYHVHMEIRYGPPGRFWNADFTQWSTLDRWMATMFADPALVVFPENHPAFVAALEEWVATQPRPTTIP